MVQTRGVRTQPSTVSRQPAISAAPIVGIAPVLRANSRATGVDIVVEQMGRGLGVELRRIEDDQLGLLRRH
jgi:hypothetical protein